MNQENLNTIISNNIKKYRIKENISKTKLSYLTRISKSTINNIENNTYNKEITIITLYRISKVLKVPINKFFEESND
jgi:transcriptional regulator with XRE-family HTH domain